MKRAIVVLLALASVAAVAQVATSYSVPVWTGTRYTWPTLGPGLVIANGVLDVLPVPPPAVKTRVHGAELAVVGTTVTPLPAGASNVAVYLNGLRQAVGSDYALMGGNLVPLWPWPPDSRVLIDYDQP